MNPHINRPFFVEQFKFCILKADRELIRAACSVSIIRGAVEFILKVIFY